MRECAGAVGGSVGEKYTGILGVPCVEGVCGCGWDLAGNEYVGAVKVVGERTGGGRASRGMFCVVMKEVLWVGVYC